MPIRTGSIATGEHFFDRTTEIKSLWRTVQENHIVFAGPRRLGKSSILKRMSEEATAHGYIAALVDVSGHDTAVEFLDCIERAFPDESVRHSLGKLGKLIASPIKIIKKVDVKLPGGVGGGGFELQALPETSWKVSALALQNRLTETPVLLLIDEFSVFLDKLIAKNKPEAEALLGWLRTWRQTDTTCRFIFSGSVGISALLERHGFTTWMNDCHEFPLGPFKQPAAMAMVIELSARENYRLPKETADYLCARTGWLSPFYLCLLLDESINAADDRRVENPESAAEKELILSDVDDAYDRLLASRSRFVHWHKRLLRDLAPSECDVALAILRALSRAEAGLTIAQLRNRLSKLIADPQTRSDRLSANLHYLEENGYVGLHQDDKVQFLSFLLKDYWKKNHGA